MMKVYKTWIFLLLSLISGQTLADQTDTLRVTDIEEITIVATPKENRKLRQLPNSATLLSHESLKTSGVENIKGLTAVVPNLYIPDYGSRLTTAVYIRGIGSRINTPSVGLYVDNIPYIDKSAFDFSYADVERIDVLRGPQGTLYGRNAMGGIIKVHTRSPFQHQGTDLKIEAATHGYYNASLTHYHRISNRFAFSAGGHYDYDGGFFRNSSLAGKKVDQGQAGGGRVRGIWLPGDNWKLDLSLNYEYSDQSGYPYYLQGVEGGEILAYNRESSYRRNLLNAGLSIEHQANHFILSAVTGYQWLADRMFLDQDFTPKDIYTLEQRQRIHTLSEEIVIRSKGNNRYEWLFGAFGFHQSTHTKAPVTFLNDGMGMLNLLLSDVIPSRIEVGMGQGMAMNIMPSLSISASEMPIDGTFDTPQLNAALFHQSTLRRLFGIDGLSFTLGLRLDYEKMKLTYNSGTSLAYSVGIEGEMSRGGQVIRKIEMMPQTALTVQSRYQGKLHKDYLQLLPRFALQYDLPSRRGNLYATISKGYRSGGYNIQKFSELLQGSLRNDMMRQSKEEIMAVVPPQYAQLVGEHFPEAGKNPDAQEAVDYRPEQTWNYEIGTHLNLFENRLSLDASAFWMETHDQQISRMASTGLGRETINAGRSRSLGGEISFVAAITNSLTLNGGYGYTHATFRQYGTEGLDTSHSSVDDYTGNFVPFVPRHTLNIGGSYTFFLKEQRLLDCIVLSTNYNGAGRIFWTEDNQASTGFYGTLNGRLSLHRGQNEVAIWVHNVLDRDYTAFYFESMGNAFRQKSRPIQAGIEVRCRF